MFGQRNSVTPMEPTGTSYQMNPIPPRGYDNPTFSHGTQPKDLEQGGGSASGVNVQNDQSAKPQISPRNPQPVISGSTDEDEEDSKEHMVQDDFEDLEQPQNPNCFNRMVKVVRTSIVNVYKRFAKVIMITFGIILAGLYFAYFGYAMSVEKLKNEASIRLLWVTCTVVFFFIIYIIKRLFGKTLGHAGGSFSEPLRYSWRQFNDQFHGLPKMIALGTVAGVISITVIIVLAVFVARSKPYNLMSLLGIFLLILAGFLGSTNPEQIQWRPILAGLLMQFVLALLIIKTTPGFEVFKFIGDRVAEFLAHTNAGSFFLFHTKDVKLFAFAFTVLPIIIFFSTFISVLYYLGAMQMVIEKVAWVMQMIMGTTAGESLNAAGNIFVGMTEAPLMIRPFIGRMTNSELHAVMTGGFATIAGSVMGAYIQFGVPANHLLSASVMSAPAALAMSKLFHPETKKSKTKAKDAAKMEKSPYGNLVEAASAGATASIKLVANIAFNLIAFLAVLEFVNQTLTWFGGRAGMTRPLTFQLICSYILWPLAFVMGVSVVDCGRVGELIGMKTFLNEFIAYDKLGTFIKNRKNYTTLIAGLTSHELIRNGSDIFVPELDINYKDGFFIDERSEIIATYSLCGFANVGSIGITLGALSAMAPHRRKDIAAIVVRAMVAGNVACFLTGCIAGLFYEPSS